MKQIIAFFFIFALVSLPLTGCSKKDEAAPAASSPEQNSAPAASSSDDIFEEGKNYYAGLNGKPVDKDKAFELFSKAAEQGGSGAMFFVGVMYANGESVAQNDQKALEWFEKSDKAGCGAAAEWITKMKKKMKK